MTIDPMLHERAKRLARHRQTSVSGLFEVLIQEQPDPEGTVVDNLIGSAQLKKKPKKPDTRREALIAKYIQK